MENKEKYLGQLISKIRKEQDRSLENVARLADLHRTTISLIERGEREPTIETAERIANALGLSLIDLLLLSNKVEKNIRKPKREYVRVENYNELTQFNLNQDTILNAIQHSYNTLDII